jgi:hypothetical protein
MRNNARSIALQFVAMEFMEMELIKTTNNFGRLPVGWDGVDHQGASAHKTDMTMQYTKN